MLFLGAGASKRFGIPSMGGENGLSEKFEREIIENNLKLTRGEQEVYLDIKKVLGTNNQEDILTVLNDLSKELKNPSVSYFKFNLDSLFKKGEEFIPKHIECLKGAINQLERKIKSQQGGRPRRRHFFARSIRNHEGKKKMYEERIEELTNLQKILEGKKLLFHSVLSENLKSKIIEFIKKECNIGEKIESDISVRTNIKSNYDGLFEILEKYPSYFSIFTTNYDTVIEKYIEFKGKFGEFYDGFSYSDHGIKTGVWNPEGYSKNYKIKLFKLHGSVDQYYHGEYGIIKTPKLILKAENAMVYPMREKEVYKDPFFELFTRLKDCLTNKDTEICIVIGYSFGDEHIQNIFNDAVKRNRKLKILLGNKNPNEVMKNLEKGKNLEPLMKNIKNIPPIKGDFGEETFFERLEEELEKCKNNS